MRRFFTRFIISTILTFCFFNISSFDSTEQDLQSVQAANFEWGTVNASTLSLRESGSTSAKTLTVLKKGKKVRCYTLKSTWVKVGVGDYTGYAYGKYISTAYGTATSPYANVRAGKVNASSLTIRKSASSSSAAVTTVKKNTSIQALTTGTTWVKVKVNGKTGYAYGKYITLNSGGTATSPGTTGQKVVEYAKKFLGNRYVWGGTSLTNGTDCSGFTMRVYQHFGYSIPRTSAQQRYCGTKVASLSKAKAGDLICYYGHVAIYMGNNKIIHASNARDGIKISYNAAYRSIAAIRRVIK